MKLALKNILNREPSLLSDEETEIVLAQQDPAQFRPLYNRYYQPIFIFILKRVESEALAADICSEVFLKALTNLPKYEMRGFPFSSWLYRIASNEINTFYRKQKKNRVVSITDAGIHSLFEELDEGEAQENLLMLKKIMGELDETSIQLIELRFFEKRSFKEMGEILEITENNAKIRTYRLLAKMRKKFNKK